MSVGRVLRRLARAGQCPGHSERLLFELVNQCVEFLALLVRECAVIALGKDL